MDKKLPTREEIIAVFSINLKNFRMILGMTQDQFATHMEIKRSTLGAYEESRCIPKIDELLRISRKIGFDMESMITKNVFKGSEVFNEH